MYSYSCPLVREDADFIDDHDTCLGANYSFSDNMQMDLCTENGRLTELLH